jgi:hypothetical protein
LATARLLVAMPLQMRARKSIQREVAEPRRSMPMAEAATLHTRRGRRPTRSLRWPQRGTKRSCISEYTAPRTVAVKSSAPYARATPGR